MCDYFDEDLEELQDDDETPKCRGDDDGGLIDDNIWWFAQEAMTGMNKLLWSQNATSK